jgi:predicted amidohydrolase
MNEANRNEDHTIRICPLQAGENHKTNGNPGCDANFELFADLAREAAHEKPDIIIFPEYAIPGSPYPPESTFREIACPVPHASGYYQRYVALAKETQCALLANIIEVDEQDRMFNTAALIGPDGAFIGKYRKGANLGDQTWQGFSQGDKYELIQYKGVKIGCTICSDMWLPEYVRCQELMGADIILHQSIADDMGHIIPTRAFDSQLPIVMCCFTGGNYAVDKTGAMLGKMESHNPGWIIFDLKPFSLHLAKKYAAGLWDTKLGSHNVRQPAKYGILTDLSKRPDWTEIFLEKDGNACTEDQLRAIFGKAPDGSVRHRPVYDQGDSADTMNKTAKQWDPFLEWAIENTEPQGNPFDLEATARFTHKESGEEIETGIFYAGGHTWKFRFTGTRCGLWAFKTTSPCQALNGKLGMVAIERNADPNANGFLIQKNNKWAWSATGRVMAPQLMMYDAPDAFYRNPQKIQDDIKTFLDEHGFNGFHVPVFCRWLDINQDRYEGITLSNPDPDPKTFEALELLITMVYRAGGMVHLWIWGDNDGNHHQTPMKDGWGGKNGPVDVRLQKYLAARLGPIPGWSAGYGFDLEHWVEKEDLNSWYANMHQEMGWFHLLGGRSGTPKREGTLHTQISSEMDYAGYTHLRPGYDMYRIAIERNPHRPVMSEDRFRIRDNDIHREKDYDETMTRRGIWHSYLAGGVGNIWGKMLPGQRTENKSDHEPEQQFYPYANRVWIATAMRFWRTYFTDDQVVGNELIDHQENLLITDGNLNCCTKRPTNQHFVFYKENAADIKMDLSRMDTGRSAIAVDALKPYAEINVGKLEPKSQTWHAPYVSDWALVIGKW